MSASLPPVPQQPSVMSSSLPSVPQQPSAMSASLPPASQQPSIMSASLPPGLLQPSVISQQPPVLSSESSSPLPPMPQQPFIFSSQSASPLSPMSQWPSIISAHSASLPLVLPQGASLSPVPQQYSHSVVSPQPQSFNPHHHFVPPSMTPLRQEDELCIDNLLSDEYDWNNSDLDCLTSSIYYSEVEGGGSGSGIGSSSSGTVTGSGSGTSSTLSTNNIPPPPFITPPELKPIEQVMRKILAQMYRAFEN